MKTSAVIRIVAFSVAIFLLSLILINTIDQNYYFENGRLRHYTNVEQDSVDPTAGQITQYHFPTDIRNLEIEWVAGSIRIEHRPNVERIYISEHYSNDITQTMICRQSGQTLKIQFCEDAVHFSSIGINREISKDLVIVVPENWNCNDLEIDAAAAEVNIQNISIRELDFDGASGNLILDNCNIVNLDIDTASGDVYFSGMLETLDCDAASADCRIEVSNIPRSIRIDGLSGDLELILPPDAGFTCNLDTMSGSFDTDFEFGMHDDTYIFGNGDCEIKVSAMSGDVSILKGISNFK